jgi:c-di-GMP-binding flagellar brake protein YcgR
MIPHDRRSATRVDTGNLVIHSEVGQEVHGQVLGMAVTLDMNEFGLRIQTSERFEPGDRFRFSVALQDEIVAATGRVVHVSQSLNETWEVGIEFLQVSSEDIEKIRQYCAERCGA